jgi:hypothetical protein
MGFERKPQKITEAIDSGDTQRLSAAGKKGAEVTNSKIRRERERQEIGELQNEIEVECKKMEDLESQRAANEHIISADGVDQDYFSKY